MLALAVCVVAAAAVPSVASARHGHKRHSRVSGTVASFDKGILAIKTGSGQIVTGQVTGRTQIECENENEANDQNDQNDDNGANDSRVARAAHDGGGDDNGGDDRGDDNGTTGPQQNQADDDQNEDQNEDQAANCDTTQLTPGAAVARASMRDRHNRTVWKNLKLKS
jgi:hypothetical protein